MNIYVASSFRNEAMQQGVVLTLREAGHTVYDFLNPEPNTGFSWRDVDPNWQNWTPEQYRDGIVTTPALQGFKSDMEALKACDVCVLVNPCGRSAHLEAGYAVGAGKPCLILLCEGDEAELMYLMCGLENMCVSRDEVLRRLQEIGEEARDA